MVTLGCGAAKAKYLADSAELNPAEGAGDVGEPVVESDVGVMEPGSIPATGLVAGRLLLVGAVRIGIRPWLRRLRRRSAWA